MRVCDYVKLKSMDNRGSLMGLLKRLFYYLRNDFIKINWDGTMTSNSIEEDFPKKISQINPTTGLPMIGALDSMGNTFGSSLSFERNYSNYDYYR